MSFDEIFEMIASSTDFNRGFSTGIIATVQALLEEPTINKDVIASVIDVDFGFDDINLLRDAVLHPNDNDNEDKQDGDN